MAEIAEASEFAVGSLYSFFNSKDEILSTIFEHHIEHVISEVEQIHENQEFNSREKIESILEALVRIYVDNQDFFRIYIAEARGVEWGVRTEVGEYIHNGTVRYLDVLSKCFNRAIDDGLIDSDLDPEFLALLLRSFIHSTVTHLIYSSRNYMVEDLLPIVKKVLFDGILMNGKNE